MRLADRKTYWLASVVLLTLLAADSSWAARQDRDLYLSAKKEYELLTKTKPAAQNRARWEKLAARFEKLPQDFPLSSYGDGAHYYAAKIYQELYRSGKEERALDRALRNWRLLLVKYPKSPLAPESRYWMAVGLEEGKGDPAEARKQYAALAEKYPQGEWAAKGRSRLDSLNKKAEEQPKDQPPPAANQAGKAILSQIRHTSSDSYTRVTMELSSETRYETHVLKEDPSKGLPARIYVDLLSSKLAMDATQPISIQDGLLRQVRAGQFSPDVVRVVLDMSSLTDYKAFLLPDPYRLVIDIQGKENGGRMALLEKKKEPLPQPKAIIPPPGASLRKIVLDPGHGGKDPGAIGVNGVAEKDIVLSVAKKLAQKLKKELGVEVVLTRKDDSFIPLEDRTAIANAERAELFISLHLNANSNPEARGLETYYLDNTSDEASIRMAARENGTSRKNISDLQFILSDLTQNSKLEDSITLANRLHGSVVYRVGQRYGEVRDLGVKKALFYVLVGARMPSVLVEMFFVTNKNEGRALAKEAYQDAIADALLEGIKKYQESTQVVKNL